MGDISNKVLEEEVFKNSLVKELKAFESVVEQTEQLRVPGGENKEVAWNNILNSIEQQEKKSAVKPILWAVAASIAILLVGYFFLYPANTIVSTENGQMLTVDLPKGSTVILNASSSIEYDPDNWQEQRLVQLKGKARFDVTPGNTFKVISDHGEVVVLGTTFDIADRKEKYEVSCLSGRVEVKYGREKKILSKNQRGRIVGEQLLVTEVDVDQVNDWVSGEFYFKEEPLGFVLNEIERQFDVKIYRPDSTDKRNYEGLFSNKNLDTALQLVLPPMNLKYEIKGKEIHVVFNK